MKRKYALAWSLLLLLAAVGAVWMGVGQAYFRRRSLASEPAASRARRESRFLAILLPRITSNPRKYAMSAADLGELLGGLKAAGFTSIGLDDVEDFYAHKRGLPAKALLIAFSEDDPQGLSLADGVLADLRLRGAAFLRRTAAPEDGAERRFLTTHAVAQMRLGGTWTFGRLDADEAVSAPPEDGLRAVLDERGGKGAAPRTAAYALRFRASDMGLDDEASDPHALRALAIRTDLSPAQNLRAAAGAWPRTAALSDDFRDEGLGADWFTGWGVVSRGRGRMALVPTPRQSGAGVFLRGTERWRDATVEFELKRYQKEFWAYARYDPDGGYLRVGTRGGYWYAEQKTGPGGLPSQLARAPMLEGAVPARVRLVLKGDAAIVHVNGRLQFGRALRVAPAVARGSVLFGVYDPRSRSALAVLSSVRAAPLAQEWLAPPRGANVFDEDRLGELREEAVFARVFSPRWVSVASDGGVRIDETQGVLVRSLAGFYGCRLMPMAELSAYGPFALAGERSAARALAGLSDAARELDAAGLNLRLRGEDAARPQTLAFLAKLRAALRARRARLWVTVDGGGPPDAGLLAAVDGVLRPSEKKWASLEVLEAAQDAPPSPAPPQTASRATKESEPVP